jgi:FtsP/CotA-like multicopper oxidase with cupredoxin domain
MLVNNQFPGPAIEANWGDEIEVIVHNNISAPMEGTAMHYHGFLQRGSNWMDGVPSVSQCPIAPGASFTYRFTAQLYGTSFYHAHYSAQYTAGVAGPIIIHGPSQLPYDIDIGPVMLTDWFHIPYFSIVKDVVGTDMTKLPPKSDSLLINGRGRFDCAEPSYSSSSDWVGSNIASNQTWECVDGAELSKFRFQSGKIHRLRLINHGADGKFAAKYVTR